MNKEFKLKVKGIKGDKGDSITGPQGIQGIQGANGKDGKDGKDGLNGKDGKNGINGKNGLNGKAGVKGEKGDAGKDGSPDTAAQVKSKLLEVGFKYDELADKPDIEQIINNLKIEVPQIVRNSVASRDYDLGELKDVNTASATDGQALVKRGSQYVFETVITPETQNLQAVTDLGSTTTNSITANGGFYSSGIISVDGGLIYSDTGGTLNMSRLYSDGGGVSTNGSGTLSAAYFVGDGFSLNNISLASQVNDAGFITASSSDDLTNKTGYISQWTNDVGYITGGALSGYVPYTGALYNTDLGAYEIRASKLGVGAGTVSGALRGVFDIYNSTTYTMADVTTSDSTLYFNYMGGAYTATGQTYSYYVYAYKTVNAVQVFSANPLIFTATDDMSLNGFYMSASWDTIAGADGYRVVVTDPSYGAYGDYYFDTPNAYFQIGGINIGLEDYTNNYYSYGSTITPSSTSQTLEDYYTDANGNLITQNSIAAQSIILQGNLKFFAGSIVDISDVQSIDAINRISYDSSGVGSLNWNARQAFTSAAGLSMDWNARTLYASGAVSSVDYGNRQLLNASGGQQANWQSVNGALFYGGVGTGFSNGSFTPSARVHAHNTGAADVYYKATNSTSGALSTDGFSFGITAALIAQLRNYENTNLEIYTNNTLRMTIGNAGNVGIGTGTLSGRLNVAGTGATGELVVTTSNAASSISVASLLAASATGDTYFSIGRALTSTNSALVGHSTVGGGNYAFMTTYGRPASDLAVYSDGTVRAGTKLIVGTSTAVTGGVAWFSGNVGIGVSSLSAALHVVSTTVQQRLGYDVSNYFDTTVGSTGIVTFNAVGAGSAFSFSDPVTATQLTSSGLTAGRVTFAGTSGILVDDADMTFATDTLTVTKIIGSTSLKSVLLESTGTIRLKGYTVATLPAGTVGDTAYVTDALAPAFLGALVGGGAITTTVFYNGTAWIVA